MKMWCKKTLHNMFSIRWGKYKKEEKKIVSSHTVKESRKLNKKKNYHEDRIFNIISSLHLKIWKMVHSQQRHFSIIYIYIRESEVRKSIMVFESGLYSGCVRLWVPPSLPSFLHERTTDHTLVPSIQNNHVSR